MPDDEDPAASKSRRLALKNGTNHNLYLTQLTTLYLLGNQMSIVDNNDVAMCHGFVVDFQPDLAPLRSNEDIPACMIGENLWHQVRFGKYLHGWGDMELPFDHIYDSDGAPLTKPGQSTPRAFWFGGSTLSRGRSRWNARSSARRLRRRGGGVNYMVNIIILIYINYQIITR
jgi:hypothetical protein